MHEGGDHTASKYILKEINDSKYLFFEWKSGDTYYFQSQPHYYVLKNEDSAE